MRKIKRKKDKLIVKMNKIGISFVIAFFFIELLIALEFNSGMVSATVASVTSPNAYSFSSSSSNPQYYQPGGSVLYSQQYASTYWPALSDPDRCLAQTDFIMNVEPLGCTPTVVRSDLLEEQNVPIFCKVDVVKINPLIDVSQIKSVKFSGSNPYVAGVSFHPNAEAIYSGRGYIENPLINDVGYVVILLKRIPAEKDMPDKIKINLTGVLRYESEGIFGAGQNEYYLSPMTDEEWNSGNNYQQNSIFKGRGFLRAEWVDANNARVTIYRDKENVLASFNLEKGKQSSTYYMPGFYCRAAINLRLDDVTAPVDRVLLNVDDNRIWLTKGERFLDNQCSVISINSGKTQASVSVDGASYIVTLAGSWLKAEETGGNKIYALDNKNNLKYYNNNEWVDASTTGSSENEKWNAKLKDVLLKSKSTFSEQSVTIRCLGKTATLSFADVVSSSQSTSTETAAEKIISADVKENFAKAKRYAQDIEAYYGNAGRNNQIYAAKAYYQLALLAEKIETEEYNKVADDLYAKIIANYPDTDYAREAELKRGSINVPSASYGEHRIELIQIESPDFNDSSAEFLISNQKTINDIETESYKIETRSGKQYLTIKPNGVFSYEGNSIEVKRIRLDNVDVYYSGIVANQKTETSSGSKTLQVGDNFLFSGLSLKLNKININQAAKVSVIASAPNDYSEAKFNVEIGIEKRAIKLSPEKTKEMIKKLNETIAKWEGIVENLGNIVSALKGLCFATSTILVVKSFFSNLEGGATARQQVMPVWYAKCQQESAGDRVTFNNCLKKYEPEIQNDIAAYEAGIKKVNEDVLKAQNANLNTAGAVDRNKASQELLDNNIKPFSYNIYGLDDKGERSTQPTPQEIKQEHLDKASLSQLREIMFYSSIYSSSASQTAKDDAANKLESIRKNLASQTRDTKPYQETGDSWIRNVPVIYNSGKTVGAVYQVPIPGTYDGKTGFYARVDEGYYTAAKDFNKFYIANIGENGLVDESDSQALVLIGSQNPAEGVKGLFELGNDANKLVQKAISAIKVANNNYGKTRFSIDGSDITANPFAKANELRCTDFMSPTDCQILFNVCDPVLCPSSRCDLGGAYPVADVIQSGIAGSIALCLPNINEGIAVPVCLTGIYAGLDSLVGILKSTRDCLQENLDTGRTVGICDEIQSIYLCEFFWRQIIPFIDLLIPSIIQTAYGQGMKGGGEYLTVMDAWKNAQNSVNYMKNEYAVNSYKAFNARSTGDIGGEFCKAFVSARYPNSKDFFDNLLAPDSPVQFSAWFDEIPFTTVTIPATSQYKVFYYIYAGQDQGASYQVYLTEPSSTAYARVQQTVVVDTGFVPMGSQTSQTKDFTAPAGYKTLCVRINGQENCGFGKVSTSFAINYLSDAYYMEQATKTGITSEKDCVSGVPSASGLLTTPNIQEGVETAINPQLQNAGITRICSTSNPGGKNDVRWAEVGYCGNENIKCWLDTTSVQNVIKNKNIEDESFNVLKEKGVISNEIDKISLTDEAADKILADALKQIKNLENEVNDYIRSSNKNSISYIISSVNSRNGKYGELFANLEELEKSDAGNLYKAVATFYMFRVYYILTNGLVSIDSQMNEIDTSATKSTTKTETAETQEKVSLENILALDSVTKTSSGAYSININNNRYWYSSFDENSQIIIFRDDNGKTVEMKVNRNDKGEIIFSEIQSA